MVGWYGSTDDDRLKRRQPRHLRDHSKGKFRGKDCAEHCETGGHPTPQGMRSLLHGDRGRIATMLRHELANHGTSAWRYLLNAVALICEELGVDPLEVIPGAEAAAVIDAKADWREHDIVGPMWAQFNRARDDDFDVN